MEEALFGIGANGDSAPDFIDAGVELKVTPYKKNKNNTLSVQLESLYNYLFK